MPGARPTLAIVQRDRPDIYEVLKAHLAAGPLADVVRVVRDRRGTEARRQRSQPVAFERRGPDRRQRVTPTVWRLLCFMLVPAGGP